MQNYKIIFCLSDEKSKKNGIQWMLSKSKKKGYSKIYIKFLCELSLLWQIDVLKKINVLNKEQKIEIFKIIKKKKMWKWFFSSRKCDVQNFLLIIN